MDEMLPTDQGKLFVFVRLADAADQGQKLYESYQVKI